MEVVPNIPPIVKRLLPSEVSRFPWKIMGRKISATATEPIAFSVIGITVVGIERDPLNADSLTGMKIFCGRRGDIIIEATTDDKWYFRDRGATVERLVVL